MKVQIVAPTPSGSRQGNRVTALRWARILRSLGHRVSIVREHRGESTDVVVALHAKKSAASAARFRDAYPEGRLIVALTGTDLYGDIHTDEDAKRSLHIASRLVVLQPLGLESLPAHFRSKTRSILQSASPPGRREVLDEDEGAFRVCVIGHLRAVKDPLRTAKAARCLPDSSRIRVTQLGRALDPELEANARTEARENPRYRWLGDVPRARALEILAGSDLMVLSSLLEGGANVLTEALAIPVPVLTSRIPGSIGILGPRYPGTFPVGDTEALAAMLLRAETDAEFYADLRIECERLKPLVDPERERQAWRALLEELQPHHSPRRRLTIVQGPAEVDEREAFAIDVRDGLSRDPKRLACRYFYDQEGSRLFEEICRLPEYYLPRAETEILLDHAAELARLSADSAMIVELGSGSATKTRIVLDAFLGERGGALRYVPVDVSREMLVESSEMLLAAYPSLEVVAIQGEYERGFEWLTVEGREAKLILWLGSNIGNFDRVGATKFLGRVRTVMAPRDRLLVGVDLRKSKETLEPAYDDALGVTARFNLNVLARINRELGGHFDLHAFSHRARYDEEIGKIEMFLVSRVAQTVLIDALGGETTFAEGECIHTEDSYKYSPDEIERLATEAGFSIERQWRDSGRRFSGVLLSPR